MTTDTQQSLVLGKLCIMEQLLSRFLLTANLLFRVQWKQSNNSESDGQREKTVSKGNLDRANPLCIYPVYPALLNKPLPTELSGGGVGGGGDWTIFSLWEQVPLFSDLNISPGCRRSHIRYKLSASLAVTVWLDCIWSFHATMCAGAQMDRDTVGSKFKSFKRKRVLNRLNRSLKLQQSCGCKQIVRHVT